MPKAPHASERLYPTSHILTKPRLQIRGGTRYPTVQRYKKAMQAGDVFPAITLAEIGNKLYVIDGHHRLEAALAARLPMILATHRRMTMREAHAEAVLANANHGLNLSQKEKQHAFNSFIEEDLHIGLSGKVKPVRTIAAECPVYTFQTVSRKLRELGIDAPREAKEAFDHTGSYYDLEPSPEDLDLEDAIYLGEFHKHLDAATASYSLLTDTSRSIALDALSALRDSLKPPAGHLEI